MSRLGSASNPLRVAVIGAGPAGFYTVGNLQRQTDLTVEMDMFDALPSPFGLVRTGVAPDHQKYKTVIRVYQKMARCPNYRFYGCVEYGRQIHLLDLKAHYHQVVFIPTRIIGSECGRVRAVKMVKNEAFLGDDGSVRARPTDQSETLPVDLIFRSVGYRGIPLPAIPFNEDRATIENEKGRIVQAASRQPLSGLYTAGWIKRGPTGVIGTNKTDAQETVTCMMEDLRAGRVLTPPKPQIEAVAKLVEERQPQFISYGDWSVIDAEEVARGQESGRPRVKFTSTAAMLAVLGR